MVYFSLNLEIINYLSLLFQNQLCRGLSGKLIKFLPKWAFGPYIWVETVDNVTGTVGNVFSFHLRADLHCHSSFSCMVFAHYWGIFMQCTWLFFSEFWSLPDHVNSCVLQPIPASALQCLVKSLLVLIPKQFSSWFFQNCPRRQSWQM